MKSRDFVRNILGAAADGAVLFPLLALLSTKSGFSGPMLLLSTGAAYLAAAVFFRVPMPIQPLKSIAVAAITVGATFEEVRFAGLALGVLCLALAFLDIDRIARLVPAALIHQIQVGLGVLLVLQGAKAAGGWEPLLSSGFGLAMIAAALAMVLRPEIGGLPIPGLLATGGLLYAVFTAGEATTNPAVSPAFRPELVVQLLLPQLCLTLANSVLATRDVCRRYFAADADRVTLRRLLISIGAGNLAAAAVGGMPYCHGSGGVTAHVRGGSTRSWSTALMGAVLLTLGIIQAFSGSRVLQLPVALVVPLLIATGVFHLQLARPTASASLSGLAKLILAAVLTFATTNLLWVLGAGALVEIIEAGLGRRNRAKTTDVLGALP